MRHGETGDATESEDAKSPAPEALGADGIVAIVILLVAATDPRVWVDSSAGSRMFWLLWWVLYLTGAIRLVQRHGVDWLRWTISHQPALCVLVTLTVASCLWSLEPLLTLRRAASVLGTTLLAIFIGFSRGPDAIMRVLQWAFAVLIVASIAVAVVGYAPPGELRGWSGIMANKNSLGAAAELATVFFVVVTVGGCIHPLAGAVLSILSLITTVYAYSRTALIALAITLVGAACLLVARNMQRLTRASIQRTAWILALGPPALAILVVPLAILLREPHALTDRGQLWAGVLTILSERPLTGYGYGAVWGQADGTLLPHIAITGGPSATNAHNSILNVASELGIPAALVACVYLFGAVSNAARLFERKPSNFSFFALVFLVSFAILGFGEAHLLQIHSLFWILFVTMSIAVERAQARGVEDAKTQESTGEPQRMEPAPLSNALSYVLVTPARNEEQFIECTLRSVIAQTHVPLRWVIVSDGSTDATDRIVQGYARHHGWIELLRVDDGEGRNFARKARAFNSGCERVRHLDFDVIGNLDADLSFGAECFRSLLQRFANLPDLGVAGSAVVEEGTRYDYRFTDIQHVSGGCQLFRRACWEEIGGYVPIARGDIDRIAVTTARMKGWQTRTFPDTLSVHHRKMGTANQRPWQAWFRRGEEDYSLGSHPVWHLGRSIYQFTGRPYVLGGLLLLAGYAYCLVRRAPRSVSPELVAFYRGEQRRRLTEIGARFMPWHAARVNEPAHAVPLREGLDRLERWIEAHDYKGYEPFDGLSSPLRALTFDNHFLKQMLLQLGRQSPINLRPLLGIKPLESTKGRGYMAWGYLALLRHTGQTAYAEKARACLEWLMRNKSPLSPEYCWGNHFDYASRAGDYATQEPIIVWTALIGQAFVDGYEILGDDRYLDVARSICSWILRLPREQLGTGICLSYLATRQLSVHNANLLGAAMLARTAHHTGAAELSALARAAVEYSCSRQRRDGSWFYADGPSYQWIDNFHTGYNLDSLKCYIDSSGDETFRPHLNRGFHYYKSTFFAPDGLPKYYHDRTYPIDIQCAAQAIETLATYADVDGDALSMATAVARWTIANMQDPRGYFYYRRYPFLVARTPMLHWGQATMYRALAYLSFQRQRVDG